MVCLKEFYFGNSSGTIISLNLLRVCAWNSLHSNALLSKVYLKHILCYMFFSSFVFPVYKCCVKRINTYLEMPQKKLRRTFSGFTVTIYVNFCGPFFLNGAFSSQNRSFTCITAAINLLEAGTYPKIIDKVSYFLPMHLPL